MRSHRSWMRCTLAALLIVLPSVVAAAPVPLTTCGMTVVGRAVLTADLDCSAHPGAALALDGTLDLNGFTLTGNTLDPAGYATVGCTGKCRVKVKGPGTIVGGAAAVSGSKVTLTHEITVRDAGEWGITGIDVQITRCQVTANGAGLALGSDGGGGIRGGKITVKRSTVDDNASFGVDASIRAKLLRASALGNGFVDIRSLAKPILADASCLVSRQANTTDTWGVCFGD